MPRHDLNDRLPRPGGHRKPPATPREKTAVHTSPSRRRERMLTQNSYLRRIGAFNFSIPAWAGKLPDGRNYNTCPSAGVCSALCYARNGTYRFPQVLAKHQRNLARVLDDLPQWEADMVAELGAAKFRGGKYVRYHDAGDFFSDDYTRAWLSVARAVPDVTFYGYTKEVRRFRRLVEPDPPENFLWCYSYGGSADHLLDPAVDRVADVFPTPEAITAAGYHSNAASDLLAVLGPSPVGMRANAIPHLRRAQGELSFREWQQAKRSGRHGTTGGRRHL